MLCSIQIEKCERYDKNSVSSIKCLQKGNIIMFDEIDLLSVSTIRMLSLDQVENALSGHPGAPLGQAPMTHIHYGPNI